MIAPRPQTTGLLQHKENTRDCPVSTAGVPCSMSFSMLHLTHVRSYPSDVMLKVKGEATCQGTHTQNKTKQKAGRLHRESMTRLHQTAHLSTTPSFVLHPTGHLRGERKRLSNLTRPIHTEDNRKQNDQHQTNRPTNRQSHHHQQTVKNASIHPPTHPPIPTNNLERATRQPYRSIEKSVYSTS